jgi:hypothetical protein
MGADYTRQTTASPPEFKMLSTPLSTSKKQKKYSNFISFKIKTNSEFLSFGPKNGLISGDFQLGLPECLAGILVVYNSQFSLGLATPGARFRFPITL